jgi:hypothetical protein
MGASGESADAQGWRETSGTSRFCQPCCFSQWRALNEGVSFTMRAKPGGERRDEFPADASEADEYHVLGLLQASRFHPPRDSRAAFVPGAPRAATTGSRLVAGLAIGTPARSVRRSMADPSRWWPRLGTTSAGRDTVRRNQAADLYMDDSVAGAP